jgi:hypothetical protein
MEQKGVEVSTRAGDLGQIRGPLARQRDTACESGFRQAQRYRISSGITDGIG